MSMVQSLNWGTKLASNNTSYGFVPGGVNFATILGNINPTAPWSAYEMQQAAKAIATFSTFTNLKFSQPADPLNAYFKLGLFNSGGSGLLGFMSPPDVTWEGRGAFAWDGVGWDYFGGGGLEPGGLGFTTILHELGHGLGLAHPHDTGGTSPKYPGVDGPTGTYGTYGHNQNVYTMMSYNHGWQTGPAGTKPTFQYGNLATPMAFDIAVLQSKYGANMNYRKGGDTYVLPDANKLGTAWASIWDAGGIDTMRYNGTKSATIDLRAATLAHGPGGGGYLSSAKGIAGGFTIANKVVIENAIGGQGADLIRGNAASNKLIGNNGSDRIYGDAGNDKIYGGNQNDQLYGGSGSDLIYGGSGVDKLFGDAGNDTMYGGSHDDRLYGGAGSDRLYGDSGNDLLYGGVGNDRLSGDAGNDRMFGGAGNDVAFGGSGSDRIYGDGGDDLLFGGTGNDWLYGGPGNDRVYGDAGNDKVYGGAGNDVLYGGNGSDQVYGDGGNDRMYGGVGNDTLYGGSGLDEIYGDAGNDRLFGGAGNDKLYGGLGVDHLYGEAGNDHLYGGRGNDMLYGGAGRDYAYFSGKLEDYDVTQKGGRIIVSHADGKGIDGVDTLVSVEFLVFSDQTFVV